MKRCRAPRDPQKGYISFEIEADAIAKDLLEIGEDFARARGRAYEGPKLPTLGLWTRRVIESWAAGRTA